jgi:hypothetical protein
MNRELGMRGPAARLRDVLLRLVPAALATRALAAQFRFDPAPAWQAPALREQ